MTRFDEFVERGGIAVYAVDRLPQCLVEVGLPTGWERFDSATGVQVWVCRTDPRIAEFGANAVLTMHHVEAALDAGKVFTMLADQQVQSVPNCRELSHELAAATEGAGVVEALTMEITHELGTIGSVTRSRIIPAEEETLIAQLTVTALRDSPVDLSNIWLAVRTGATGGSTTTGHHGGVPGIRTREAY